MSLDPWNEGVRYGRGVFETLKVRNGEALLKDWHYESLQRACEALDLPFTGPSKFKLHSGMKDGIWRWFVTREDSWDLWHFSKGETKESYSMSLSPLVVSSQAWEVRFKTMSYLLHIQARENAYTDECVLLNERQEIATASMGNLFWVKNGVVYTPDSSCGCREGVLRRWVLEVLGEKVKVGSWKLQELDEAEEVFVTNSLIGIMPVVSWSGDKRINFSTQGVVDQMRQKYHKEVLKYCNERLN